MPMPRLYVLTDAKPGQNPERYLVDRDRFPADPILTTDLGKARTWSFTPGCRRWVKRNLAALPMLAELRRVWVNEDIVEAARATARPAPAALAIPTLAGGSASSPKPRRSGPGSQGKRHHVMAAIPRRKSNPNKRAQRTPGRGRKSLSKGSGATAARKAAPRAKAA